MHQSVQFLKILDHLTQGTVAAVPDRFLDGGPGFGLFLKDNLANTLHFLHERANRIQSFIGLLESKVLRHGKKYTRKQVDRETGILGWLYNLNILKENPRS